MGTSQDIPDRKKKPSNHVEFSKAMLDETPKLASSNDETPLSLSCSDQAKNRCNRRTEINPVYRLLEINLGKHDKNCFSVLL